MARWKIALFFLGQILLIISAWTCGFNTGRASAAHFIFLPYVPDIPAIHNLWETGEWTYCFDSRSSVYPNFRAQVRQVMAAYRDVLGINSREVSFGSIVTTGCEIQETMPEIGGWCNGCAANVNYANWPVTVRYMWQLGFVYWTGTAGHETGHITGLHEQYQDVGGIQCTHRIDTVMDCGSHVILPPLGIWFPQEFDINNLRGWLVPPQVNMAGLAYHQGRPFAWFCGGDPHPVRADHTAIMYWDVSTSGAFYWSGIQTPIARLPDAGGDGCIREYVYCYPGRQIWVNQQISGWPGSSQIWYLRNDVLAGTC